MENDIDSIYEAFRDDDISLEQLPNILEQADYTDDSLLVYSALESLGRDIIVKESGEKAFVALEVLAMQANKNLGLYEQLILKGGLEGIPCYENKFLDEKNNLLDKITGEITIDDIVSFVNKKTNEKKLIKTSMETAEIQDVFVHAPIDDEMAKKIKQQCSDMPPFLVEFLDEKLEQRKHAWQMVEEQDISIITARIKTGVLEITRCSECAEAKNK